MSSPARARFESTDGWSARVIRDRRGVSDLEPAYRVLFGELPKPNPFLSPEWVYAWVNTLGRRFELCFLVCFKGAELRGVWPFFEQPVPALRPFLLPVAAQTADLFDPIAREDACIPLFELLADLSAQYSAVWLPLLSDSFVSGEFGAFLSASKALSLLRHRTVRLQVDLSRHGGFKEYIESTFQPRTRQGIRRKQRRMEEAGGVDFTVCRTPEELEQFIPEVVRLERSSWKQAQSAGIFKDPGHNAFYFILLQEVAKRGGVKLSLLRVRGTLAAFELGFLGTGSYHMHAMAYLPQFGEFSPGRLLALSVLEGCFSENLSTYDFLQNEQAFKRSMANHQEPLWDCVLVPRGILGRVMLLVVRLLHRWKSKSSAHAGKRSSDATGESLQEESVSD